MEFKEYSSIENSYREKLIEVIIEEGFGNLEYIVQEKVHGSNLSLWTDGKNIKSAKRGQFLLNEDDFYNHQLIMETYSKNIFKAFELINELKEGVKFISIFGEIFGGSYPHPDIKKSNKASKVQKKIYYSPENDFYAFDILVNGDYYLDMDIVNNIFEKCNFFYAKILFRGNLKDALIYPNNFESKIPEWLNLPKIENNLCEGVVIKPIEHKILGNNTRLILKNKNKKWEEKTETVNKVKEKSDLSPKVEGICLKIENYITKNRLDNVTSKIGEVTMKDFVKILELYSTDVMKDFNKDNESELETLNKKEMEVITKVLNDKSVKLIRSNLMKNK
ncbi:MAG: RNA ligase family protein [Cyanobacteriota bacterium]